MPEQVVPPKTKKPNKLVTVSLFARIYEVSTQSVYERIARQTLPVVDIPKSQQYVPMHSDDIPDAHKEEALDFNKAGE